MLNSACDLTSTNVCCVDSAIRSRCSSAPLCPVLTLLATSKTSVSSQSSSSSSFFQLTISDALASQTQMSTPGDGVITTLAVFQAPADLGYASSAVVPTTKIASNQFVTASSEIPPIPRSSSLQEGLSRTSDSQAVPTHVSMRFLTQKLQTLYFFRELKPNSLQSHSFFCLWPLVKMSCYWKNCFFLPKSKSLLLNYCLYGDVLLFVLQILFFNSSTSVFKCFRLQSIAQSLPALFYLVRCVLPFSNSVISSSCVYGACIP